MKSISSFKLLFLATLIGVSSSADAQKKAVAYGAHTLGGGTTVTSNNWYKNYVGLRLEVTGPVGSAIIGDKQYTTGNDGSGASGAWGAAVTAPIVDKPIIMAPTSDSIVNTTALAGGSMTGKIAFIYRGLSEFGHKALQAQNAGALACVIVNNVIGGPVGMAAGSEGGSVTSIPVFMISKEDGDAIDAQYRSGAAVTMTITNWGLGKTNDLGFVPNGLSMWHSFAIPANQLATGSPEAYKAVDGAFIANYGSSTMTGVSLSSALTFTASRATTSSTLHTSTVNLTSFPVSDSIWAMFDTLPGATNVYSFTGTGTGRYDQTFTIAPADDYMGDNTATTSFFATDSLYSKGRYDFVGNKPVCNLHSGKATPTEFIWGPMYYVNKGGASVSAIQYSLSMNTIVAGSMLDAGSNDIYLMKWVDGSNGSAADGVMQNGELTMVGKANRQYDISSPSAGDTSGAILMARNMSADLSGRTVVPVILEDNTWYYLAIDVPSGYFLGCDGVMDGYPRIYGKYYSKAHSSLEYNNVDFDGSLDVVTGSPTDNNPVIPYSQVLGIQSIDSFMYSETKGIIPSVAMIVNNNPPLIDHTGVKNVTAASVDVELSPNPAKDNISVSVQLDRLAPTVSYEIIDGLARFVSKEVHKNVQTETASINTANLAAGNYYLIVNANGTVVAKKFTIVK